MINILYWLERASWSSSIIHVFIMVAAKIVVRFFTITQLHEGDIVKSQNDSLERVIIVIRSRFHTSIEQYQSMWLLKLSFNIGTSQNKFSGKNHIHCTQAKRSLAYDGSK